MISMAREDLIVLMEGGYLYLRMGRHDEAREVFEGVSVLAPESEVPVVALGSVFFSQMKYDQAIATYKKALTVKPDSAFARAYLGEALFFKGKKEEALSELEKAISLDSGGKSAIFAQTLKDAIHNGYMPPGAATHH